MLKILKQLIKSYNFWITIISIGLLIATIVSDSFGLGNDNNLVTEIVSTVLGVLVFFELIPTNRKGKNFEETKNNIKMDLENSNNSLLEKDDNESK